MRLLGRINPGLDRKRLAVFRIGLSDVLLDLKRERIGLGVG